MCTYASHMCACMPIWMLSVVRLLLQILEPIANLQANGRAQIIEFFFFSWVMDNQDLERKNSEWALFFFFFFLFFVVTVDFYYKDGNYGEI